MTGGIGSDPIQAYLISYLTVNRCTDRPEQDCLCADRSVLVTSPFKTALHRTAVTALH